MTNYYSVVRFCPDPATGERINIGVVVFGDGGSRVVSTKDWARVRQFGCKDVGLLQGVLQELKEIPGEDLASLHEQWSHSIRLTKPAASMLSLEQLCDDISTRLLRQTRTLCLSGADAFGLRYQPPYVVHQLLNCAPSVVRDPSFVFQGLRDDDAQRELVEGRAYVGSPSARFDNTGTQLLAPAGKVFVVYADSLDHVFDWDWVDADGTGHPVRSEDRFRTEVADPDAGEFVMLEGIQPGTLDASRAVYSRSGDCMFYYWADEPAFAQRINDDLTVFYTFEGANPVGIKLKNISRIASLIIQNAKESEREELRNRVARVTKVIAQSMTMSTEGEDVYPTLLEQATKAQEIVEAGDVLNWGQLGMFSRMSSHTTAGTPPLP